MTDEQILRTWLGALSEGDTRRLKVLTDDRFEMDPPQADATPMDRETFLGVVEGLWRACPDWDVTVDDVHEEDEAVLAEISIRGTQQADLDLTGVGLGWKPGSGTSFEVEGGPLAFALDDGRVTAQRSGPGDLWRVLSQLGLPSVPHPEDGSDAPVDGSDEQSEPPPPPPDGP